MPRRQDEDVNQSVRQLDREDNGRRPRQPDDKRQGQGIEKDQRGQIQPKDKKRALLNR
jgi:hypothetical protein